MITLLQIMIISVIVSYILAKMEKSLKQKKLTYLFLLIFCLPPVIDNNLFTLRTSMISFLFVLMVYHFIQYFKEEKFRYLLYINFIASIIGNWKSELFYIPILVWIYTLFIGVKKNNIKKNLILCCLSILLFGLFSIPQKKDSNYIFTAIINPLSVMINDEVVFSDLDIKDKTSIDNIITLDNLKKSEDYQNIPAYMVFIGKRKYSKIQKINFIKTYAKIVLKHPYKFLNARISTYKATNFSTDYEMPNHTGAEYPSSQWESYHPWYYSFSERFNYTKSIIPVGYKKIIISNLLMRNSSNYSPNKLNHIFYNVTWILVLSFLAILIFIIRKKWNDLYLLMVVLLQFPIIFITAPATFWMYYICLYIVLHFLLLYYFVKLIDKSIN